jgi:hypothetical protein
MTILPGQTPRVVRAFFSFCVAAVSLDLILMLPRLHQLRGSIVPFAGWVPSMPYLFSISTATRPGLYGGLRNSLFIASVMLCIYAVFGVAGFVFLGGPNQNENPWLRISVWYLLWTFVIPVTWAFVLRRQARGYPTHPVESAEPFSS